jgi:hypothetical protein
MPLSLHIMMIHAELTFHIIACKSDKDGFFTKSIISAASALVNVKWK